MQGDAAFAHARLVGILRCRAVAVFHLLADRMTMEGWFPLGCDGSRMECPRTAELEQSLGKSRKDKSAPTLWVIALVSLTTGYSGPAVGDIQNGERRYLIDLLETLPQAVLQSVLLVCDAGYVGYDLFGLLLKQQCSFLIRLLFAGTTLQPVSSGCWRFSAETKSVS